MRGRLWPGTLAVLLAATLAGCQGAGGAPAAVDPAAGVDAPQRRAEWREADLAIVPAADYQVQQASVRRQQGVSKDQWFDGDRHRMGAVSPYWGSVPLGYGYTDGGLLPFISGNLGGFGTSLYYLDPAGATVYQVPALDDLGIVDGSLSGGGRFVSFIDYTGRLGVYDSATQLIRVFPELENYYLGYGGWGYGLFAADDQASGKRPTGRQPWGRPGGVAAGAIPFTAGYGQGFDADAFGNMVYLDPAGRVRVFDPRTYQEYIVVGATRGLTSITDLSVSPDGRYITVAGSDLSGPNLYVSDLTGGRQLTVPFVGGSNPYGLITSSSVNPVTNQVLYTENGQARLLDLNTGFIDNLPLLNSAVPGYGDVFDADFLDPAGQNIVYTRYGQLQVYNRATHLIDTLPIANRDAAVFGGAYPFSYGPVF